MARKERKAEHPSNTAEAALWRGHRGAALVFPEDVSGRALWGPSQNNPGCEIFSKLVS